MAVYGRTSTISVVNGRTNSLGISLANGPSTTSSSRSACAGNASKGQVNGTRIRTATPEQRDPNSCRIVILGLPGVGKTALTVRYITKRFIGEYCPTLESIYKYQTQTDGDDVRLSILDTAGNMQEPWKDYYSMWGDCFVFVYSITDRASFEEVVNLKQRVESLRQGVSFNGILVGNKSDLLHDRQVPEEDGFELADEIGCKYYEVSAADWTQVANIEEMFQYLVKEHRKARFSREGRQRKTSSSTRFRQAIQKVISGGKTSNKKPSTVQ